MYIKWIVCEVKDDRKDEFSLAQEQWIDIKYTQGLIGQIGGWDLNFKNTACIIAFWKNKDSVELFMDNLHNKIVLANKQSEYYNSIEVDYFNSILSMQGECESLLDAIKKAKLLRVADCLVKKEKESHFAKVQKEIWLPGMKSSTGLLGGEFSVSGNNELRYLVSTLWSFLNEHEKYTETILPKLKKSTGIQNDINNITGRQILLVDSWKVVNTKLKKYCNR